MKAYVRICAVCTYNYGNVNHAFTAILFDQWKKLLGPHMIDYSKLTVKEVLAKGECVITYESM